MKQWIYYWILSTFWRLLLLLKQTWILVQLISLIKTLFKKMWHIKKKKKKIVNQIKMALQKKCNTISLFSRWSVFIVATVLGGW